MPYIPLRLEQNAISKVISMFTESYLEQVHYLLSAHRPEGGLGRSAVVMTLLAIAAASRLRTFDPTRNNKQPGISDRESFVETVTRFFPWSDVIVVDDQYRSGDLLRAASAEELYDVFRNPFVHSGGVTAKPHLSGKIGDWYRVPQICHVFPGLSPSENEMRIDDSCAAGLAKDTVLELGAFASKVHTRPLYLCARRMIENISVDPKARAEIANAIGI